jgi:CheY-like chemotaxis protein
MRDHHSTTSWPDLSGICVLVIDDDDDARATMAATLHHAGATMTSAAAGDHALDDLTQFLPDIIVCDLRMPRLDGAAFIARLRQRAPEEGGRLPVVGITAYPEAYSLEEAAELGFAAFLPKPIDLERLCDVVRSVAREAVQPTR